MNRETVKKIYKYSIKIESNEYDEEIIHFTSTNPMTFKVTIDLVKVSEEYFKALKIMEDI